MINSYFFPLYFCCHKSNLGALQRDVGCSQCASRAACHKQSETGFRKTRLFVVSESVGDGRQRGVAIAHRDSLVGALRPALLAAQLFSLLPVDGAASVVSPIAPAFRWRSPRVLYTLCVSFGTVIVAFLAAYHAVATGLSFRSSGTFTS